MRLSEIQARRGSMLELQQIVSAMRSLASMRVQECLRALPSVRHYEGALAQAVGTALGLIEEAAPPAPRSSAPQRAVLVCSSEHGFVGAFNERLLDRLEADLAPSDRILIVGSRGISLATERGHRIAWQHPMATALASVPQLVRQVSAELYRLISGGEITRAEVICARHEHSGPPSVQRRRLFPLEQRTGARLAAALPPLHTLPAAVLLEKLTAEYLLGCLMEALTESLAGENDARFAAMESAHDNVSRKLDQLAQQESQARQEEVTTELLDLVTGEQALSH